ncbi:VirB8/TrbF family protein (plasmid) [Vibrio alfacsensis]|uniref:VirB8/TrbF family protein n=1 Tax=Vibrio alfacsensis TaxID=1074311 RepID=UPI002ADD3F9A|nr:VirB8/TrbF family protein [Vibrio alfacsensis]WQE79448.1 VirB8/TrbF family protein [Vibrio alfacsensis]
MDNMPQVVAVEDNDALHRDPHAPLLAQLRAERNRWFMTALAGFVLSALLVLFCWYAFAKAELNQEIVFVKLEPNGAWSVIDYEPQDSQLYFKTTIDASLERYAISRYKSDPATIESDWGEASVFMSAELREYFLAPAPQGFDAWKKIEQIRKSKTKADILVRDVEHYDQVDYLSDAGQSSKVIRSNIYFTRTLTVNGQKRPPESLVLSVQWKLVTKQELVQHPKTHLRINPIGVEILTEQLKKERSSE